jgi:hypothetical protein
VGRKGLVAQTGSAPLSHSGGREFDSPLVHTTQMRYVPANKAGLTTLHGGWSPPQRRRHRAAESLGRRRHVPLPCAASMDGYASGSYPEEQGSSPWRRTQERPCHLGAGWCGSTGSNELARLDGAGSHPPRPGGRSRSVAQLAEPAIDAEMRVRIAPGQHMPSKLRWKQRWREEPEDPGSTPGGGTSARGWSGRHARPRRLQGPVDQAGNCRRVQG